MTKKEQACKHESAADSVLGALLTENQVAEILGVSVATIRRRRLFRQPPAFVKIGASVRYTPQSVQLLISNSEQKVKEGLSR